MELSDKKFAVLIDADNISHRKIKDILDEIANYGTPTIKRIYGDFTDPKFAAWKSILLENSITPIQQYAYTTGKNATDSALIIDAMDILHKESVNGFCIVSSDSDYTRLASRIRESGREVLGFGEKKTPKPFIKSCDKFIYVEILGQPAAPTPALAPAPGTAPAATQAPAAKAAQKKTSAKRRQTSDTQAPGTPEAAAGKKTAPAPGQTPGVVPASELPQVTVQAQTLDPAQSQSIIRPIDDDFKDLLANTIEDAADDSGWAFLGIVGSVLTKNARLRPPQLRLQKTFAAGESPLRGNRNRRTTVRKQRAEVHLRPEQNKVNAPSADHPSGGRILLNPSRTITRQKEVAGFSASRNRSAPAMTIIRKPPGKTARRSEYRNKSTVQRDSKRLRMIHTDHAFPFFDTGRRHSKKI